MNDQQTEKKLRPTLVGEVISDKMQKTIVVRVPRSFVHPQYKKVVRTDKTYKVHDEQSQAHVGDTVEISEGRHISKTKYMHLTKVLNQSAQGK